MDIAEQAYNAAREGQVRHHLVWVTALNLASDELESVGLWTGPDDQVFTIDGENRTYYGGGAALAVDDIEGGVGFDVRHTRVALGLRPESENLIRGHSLKMAPVEIHTAAFHLATNNLVAEPRRVFFGWVNETPIVTPAEGGVSSIELVCASAARALTRRLPLYRSDSAMRQRNPDDGFRKDVSSAGLWEVPWGEKRVRAGDHNTGSGGDQSDQDDRDRYGP